MLSFKPLAPAAPLVAAKPTLTPALTAPVNRLLPFSCVDGPGSRMVVFFQGCNMDCPGCHNPQTIGHCNHCLECLPHCPHGGISDASRNGKRRLAQNTERCQRCDHCLPHCSRGASPYARRHSVAELVKPIAEQALLLDGVTVSGGEATLHHKFIAALFAELAHHDDTAHLSRLIDSNGLLEARHWPALLAQCDGVMLDIKAMDSTLHKSLTGRDNARVLHSAQLLAEADKLTELRFLVIGGQNDHVEELDALARFITALPGQRPLKLNGYRHHGVREAGRQWPETGARRLAEVADRLRQQGVDVRVNGDA
ncbi:YjjW family glycine radical enzyme activase [Ferrimonas balearica]|uniref:YjjW family glycine radical enzyme activase n=1 Tax=Ferrimonas balearica TaxID=44012 RepID=UPI001C9A18A2|nr:YjjW family glycine radical enzyme activase [Ferrimonas balearica]MBY5991749.1 YjjW family glycine radical enzyme activase [Ferrimonas balearica]